MCLFSKFCEGIESGTLNVVEDFLNHLLKSVPDHVGYGIFVRGHVIDRCLEHSWQALVKVRIMDEKESSISATEKANSSQEGTYQLDC